MKIPPRKNMENKVLPKVQENTRLKNVKLELFR